MHVQMMSIEMDNTQAELLGYDAHQGFSHLFAPVNDGLQVLHADLP